MKTCLMQSETDTLQRIAAKYYADWTLWPQSGRVEYIAADYGSDCGSSPRSGNWLCSRSSAESKPVYSSGDGHLGVLYQISTTD